MAVYKVIQDIEAEDKLIGPLGIKGFVYAAIAALCGFISFRIFLITSLGAMRWPIIFILILPTILFAVLALPLGHDQPTEVWLLSHVKFLLAARLRIWNQSGVIKLVTITVPKKFERQLTKNLTGDEVKSRLQTLATTLDSRGWAIKSANVSLSNQPDYLQAEHIDSDRLVGASTLVKETPAAEVKASDDIMDENHNVTAQNFDKQLQKADHQRKKSLLGKVEKALKAATIKSDEDRGDSHSKHHSKTARPGAKKNIGGPAHDDSATDVTSTALQAATNPADDDDLISDDAGVQQPAKDNQQAVKSPPQPETEPSITASNRQAENSPLTEVTATSQAAKLELAQSGNDLSVASIASLANHSQEQADSNEVVIRLR